MDNTPVYWLEDVILASKNLPDPEMYGRTRAGATYRAVAAHEPTPWAFGTPGPVSYENTRNTLVSFRLVQHNTGARIVWRWVLDGELAVGERY